MESKLSLLFIKRALAGTGAAHDVNSVILAIVFLCLLLLFGMRLYEWARQQLLDLLTSFDSNVDVNSEVDESDISSCC